MREAPKRGSAKTPRKRKVIDDSSESEAHTVRVPGYHKHRLSLGEQYNHNQIADVKPFNLLALWCSDGW